MPEHWVCTECGKMFSDEYGNGEIQETEAIEAEGKVAAQAHEHPLTHHPAQTAGHMTAGNIEYWHCATCGKNYSDAAATTEITGSVVIPAEPHDFDSTWTCAVCGAKLTLSYNEPAPYTKIASYGYTFSVLLNIPYDGIGIRTFKNSMLSMVVGDGAAVEVIANPGDFTAKATPDGTGTVITLTKKFVRSLTKNKTYFIGAFVGTAAVSNILDFRVSSSPRTGDDSNIGLWIAIGAVSLVAVAGIVTYLVLSRKRGGRRKR